MYGMRTYMDLEQAINVANHPRRHRPHRWERALRILMRWAKEPCDEEEYQRRLHIAARVFIPYKAWADGIEAERLRFERIINSMTSKHRPKEEKKLLKQSNPKAVGRPRVPIRKKVRSKILQGRKSDVHAAIHSRGI